MKRQIVLLQLFVLTVLKKNKKKVDIVRKSGLFQFYGEGGYYHPCWLPSHPELITIGNNVTIAADVRLYEHDLIRRMFNEDPNYTGPNVKYYTGPITIKDNAVLGARSIILYNVTIGKNTIVGAGSVVTKDVPDYAIVVGNPARIVGDTRELLKKRLAYSGIDVSDYNYERLFREAALF